MRMAWGVVLATVAVVAPAWSSDIYRWTDSSGSIHYSNIDGADGGTKIAPAERAGGEDDDETEASTATDRRLRELDGRLASLARARGRNAAGSAATGGVGTDAIDVRSEEEKALA